MARFPSSTFFHLYSAKRSGCNKVTHSPLNRSFHSLNQWGRSVSSKSSHLCVYNSQFRRCLSYLVNLQTANLSPQSPTNKEFTRVVLVRKSLSTLASDDSEFGDEANATDTKHVASRDPIELYRELRDYDTGSKKTGREWEVLVEIFKSLAQSGWASNQALAIYIGLSFYPTAVQKFRGFFMKNCSAEITDYLVSIGPSQEAERFLFPIFVEYCLENFPDEIRRFCGMVQCADLTKPHTWYPFARAMKRKIVYHCGPTNSGKTFNALKRFMEAEKGVYCSPLRLLATEVFNKVSHRVICNLLTGQEQENLAFANHVVCTVEMVSIDDLYDVAVIDEIQMMADSCRGFAWTRALLGLKADEIHLCGDSSVLNIVRKICSDTGDELVEHHYERLKPLEVQQKTLLGDLRNVQRGDCVVAFSRREIFEVKLAIEKLTSHRCCVIYGSLPPKTRQEQANLFNEKGNGYDVLVASDAIGMGMNLDIGRVVFYTLSKYNGDKIVPVPATQVKQIAGRAGRMGKDYPKGLTTTLHLEDLDYLNQCVNQPVDEVKRVGLFPFFEQVELFAGKVPNLSLCELLDKFSENCRLDGSFFLSRHDHIKKVARMLEEVPGLSLQDRFNFCFAPVNIRDPKAMHYLLKFAKSYSQSVPARITMGVPKGSARNDSELLDLETKHQILSMYLWLSLHFKDESFPLGERTRAEEMATDIAKLLGQSLEKVTWEPESRSMNSKPPQKQDLSKKSLIQKQDLPKNSKPAQKQDVYQRPLSLVKLFKLNKREHVSHPNFSEKVADISP